MKTYKKNWCYRTFIVIIIISISCVLTYKYVKKSVKIQKMRDSIVKLEAQLNMTKKNYLEKLSDQEIINLTTSSKRDVQSLYQMMKDIHEIFEAAGIKYSIHDGTLLGAVRHQSLIPWDDDIDVMILLEDELKLNKLKEIFIKLDYNLVESNSIYKVSIIGNPVVNKNDHPSFKFTKPFIDIFVMYENKQTKLIEYYKMQNKLSFPKEKYAVEDFFPLKLYQYGPLQLWGPNNAINCLNNLYGNNWDKEIKIHIRHYESIITQEVTREFKGVLTRSLLPQETLQDRINEKLKKKIHKLTH